MPATGLLAPGGKQSIQLDFISTTVRTYDVFLSVDVEGVGEGLLSLPIRAVCRVPSVCLRDEELSYGDCCIRYPYSRVLVLANESDLHARFEIQEQVIRFARAEDRAFPPLLFLTLASQCHAQETHSVAIGVFTPETAKGTIPPRSELSVPVQLVCEKLGALALPVYVRIAGSTNPPPVATLVANGTGPQVVVDCECIAWGNTPCLVNCPRTLMLTNKSLIPAPWKAVLKQLKSSFLVDVSEGVLQPLETACIQVVACLDDTISQSDTLSIVVTDAEAIQVCNGGRG